MRFKHRSTARVEERPEGFYQPPAGAQNGGEASSEGNPSARPASADRTQRSAPSAQWKTTAPAVVVHARRRRHACGWNLYGFASPVGLGNG